MSRALWVVVLGMWAMAHASALVLAEPALVTTNDVNVRAQPNPKSEVLFQLNKGDLVEMLPSDPVTTPTAKEPAPSDANAVPVTVTWKKIQLPAQYFEKVRREKVARDVLVWIHKEMVDIDPKSPREGIVAKSEVNVRAGASANYPVLGRLKEEDKVQILKTQGDWLGIKPSAGIAGWVAAEFLAPPPPVVAIAPPPPPEPIAPPLEKPVPTPVKPNPPLTSRDGILRAHSGNIPRPGTHELWNESPLKTHLICYLDSKDINLTRFIGKKVRVSGDESAVKNWEQPLLVVKKIEVVE